MSLVAVLLAAIAAAGASSVRSSSPSDARRPDPEGLTVHEWGTFTSIAAVDGSAQTWVARDAAQDLPCFVRRIGVCAKCSLEGTVRMETPVLYFYAPRPMTASVSVRFRQGAVTEWFPQAQVVPDKVDQKALDNRDFESSIVWPAVKVMPGSDARFPSEAGANHYYAARATDAAPVQIDDASEKFLFYRGVGRFQPPIAATVDAGGNITAWHPQNQPLGDLILFDNRQGTSTYQIRKAAGSRVTFSGAGRAGSTAALRTVLQEMLVAQGLFEKEAAAMVATWRDSWFEDGTRLLYIMPRPSIDATLPLDVKPRPADIARVFVGRLELLTPSALHTVREMLDKPDLRAIQKYGRFFWPTFDRVMAAMTPDDRQMAQQRLNLAYSTTSFAPPVNYCR